MYCFWCMGENVDWVNLSCPDCGANEENGWRGIRRNENNVGDTSRNYGCNA